MRNSTFTHTGPGRRNRRRRGTARLFALSTLLIASTAAGLPSADAQTPAAAQSIRAVQFSIPAGPLRDVLSAFERVAGIKVLLALDSIGDVQSPGVTGLLSVERALQQLLSGTEVAARFTSTTEAVLELRARSALGHAQPPSLAEGWADELFGEDVGESIAAGN